MREPSPRMMRVLIPLGFLIVIGTMVAMAIWPTATTLVLAAVAIVYTANENHQSKKRRRRGTEGSSGTR